MLDMTEFMRSNLPTMDMLGIDAENKKILATRNPNAQDLSISNVVMINRDLVITLPHKR
jgi:hypothetical protein